MPQGERSDCWNPKVPRTLIKKRHYMLRIIKTKYLQEVLILAMLLLAASYARTRLPAENPPAQAKVLQHR